MNNEKMRFGFGENWADYIEKNFSEERLEISRNHLLGFLKLQNLADKTFLDIGCGSGIHSLAAYRSGAKKIISIDYDINSVETTRYLHKYAGSPENWEIYQGSVLDVDFMKKLGLFDIVYSWGVLHHTGEMWQAVRNAAIPLKDDGVFYIALYTTDVYIRPTPDQWLLIKQEYNKSGNLRKRYMEFRHATRNLFIPYLIRGKNPLKYMREYKQSRGMSYWTDIRDWLGGWPMEFAGLEETKAYCQDILELKLLNISAGEANTEYLFRKKSALNYWDDFIELKPSVNIQGPFSHAGKHAWMVEMDLLIDKSDSAVHPRRSSLMLYEDGMPLGFAHMPLSHIQEYGKSRYCHWENKLYFSSTDNTDPDKNGRKYSYRLDILA